jgi:hypothetical protein
LEHVAGPLTYGSEPGFVELGEGGEVLPLGSQFFFDDVSQMKNAGHAGFHEDADEALRIHKGEIDPRGIYGEATPEQAEALADEGVQLAQIPWLPRADS